MVGIRIAAGAFYTRQHTQNERYDLPTPRCGLRFSDHSLSFISWRCNSAAAPRCRIIPPLVPSRATCSHLPLLPCPQLPCWPSLPPPHPSIAIPSNACAAHLPCATTPYAAALPHPARRATLPCRCHLFIPHGGDDGALPAWLLRATAGGRLTGRRSLGGMASWRRVTYHCTTLFASPGHISTSHTATTPTPHTTPTLARQPLLAIQ